MDPAEPAGGLAICLNRSIRGAVRRNRLKRITRVAVDSLVPFVKKGLLAGIFPADRFDRLKPEERTRAIRELFEKANLLESEDRAIHSPDDGAAPRTDGFKQK